LEKLLELGKIKFVGKFVYYSFEPESEPPVNNDFMIPPAAAVGKTVSRMRGIWGNIYLPITKTITDTTIAVAMAMAMIM
jgi:hypothetical protein